MASLLLVEDEIQLAQATMLYLESLGYEVVHVDNGMNAMDIYHSKQFDLILLDIMLPVIDGWSICRKIRSESSTPIIMLTARGEEYDVVFGFELGVDDYITKPFSLKELGVRIQAVLRRSQPNQFIKSNSIDIGSLTLLPSSREVFVSGTALSLTPKEYDLLWTLIQHPEMVLSRDQLLQKVWDFSYSGDTRTVDTHIKQLREKLGDAKLHVQTVWGCGYRWRNQPHE